MPRPKVGDIIEIEHLGTKWYARHNQYLKGWGSILEVLRAPRLEPPLAGSDAWNAGDSTLTALFPLGATVSQGLIKVVGHDEAWDGSTYSPIFRDGVVDPKTGRVETWWLWDGRKEWVVGGLSPAQASYPLRRIINLEMLVYLLRTGGEMF